MRVCVNTDKDIFLVAELGMWVTSICQRALDLRPQELVPTVCNWIKDAQEEHVFIIL